MQRITINNLRALCRTLNKETNSPPSAYARCEITGRNIGQVGHYLIDCAYGGYKLARIVNEGGGEQDILSTGYTTARDLYNQIHAYLTGLRA